MGKPNIGIVIPTYRGHDLVVDILESLSRQTAKCRAVVVNDYPQEQYAVPRKYAAFASCINNKENLGLAKSLNAGINAHDGKAGIVVILHDDMLPQSDDWLERMAAPFSDPKVGSVQSQYVIDFANLTDAEKCFSRSYFMGKDAALAKDDRGIEEIKFGGDSADAFRYSALESAGFFDESFRTANEDTALSVSLRKAGWKLLRNNDCKTMHRFNKSGRIGGWWDYAKKAVQITGNNAHVALKYGVFHKVDALLAIIGVPICALAAGYPPAIFAFFLASVPLSIYFGVPSLISALATYYLGLGGVLAFAVIPIGYLFARAGYRSLYYILDYRRIDFLAVYIFAFDLCYSVISGFGWLRSIFNLAAGRKPE